jgi:multiple sugar transport system permease protein
VSEFQSSATGYTAIKTSRLYQKTTRIIGRVILYFILIFFFLIFAYPFWHVFILATRDYQTIYMTPPPTWFGDMKTFLQNWDSLFQRIPYHRNMYNSLGIAVCATGTQIFFCTMAGFAFAKYDFKFKNILFPFILITIMLPRFLWLIPTFQMMVWLKWVNTWLPMIIPQIGNAFGIFLMTQFIEGSVPIDLIDAARIDGMGEFKILLSIGFPLSRAGIAVLGTISFVFSWNDFMYAMIMLNKEEAYTIPVALAEMNLRSEGVIGGVMLGNALALIPILTAFIFFSKQIISNMLAGSLKG